MKTAVLYFTLSSLLLMPSSRVLAGAHDQDMYDSSAKESNVSLVKSGVWAAHMVKETSDPEHPNSKVRQHDQEECVSTKQAASIDGLVAFANKRNTSAEMKCSYGSVDHSDKGAHWTFSCDEHFMMSKQDKYNHFGGDSDLLVQDSEHFNIRMKGWANVNGQYLNGTSDITLTWKHSDPFGRCE